MRNALVLNSTLDQWHVSARQRWQVHAAVPFTASLYHVPGNITPIHQPQPTHPTHPLKPFKPFDRAAYYRSTHASQVDSPSLSRGGNDVRRRWQTDKGGGHTFDRILCYTSRHTPHGC